MSGFVAVIDTNCLYPSYLRDILLEFAHFGAFNPAWSDQILDELIEIRIRLGRIENSKINKIREALNRQFPDANIKGHEALINEFDCPDPKDQHVLAAAVFSKASLIVTADKSGFPKDCFEKHGVEIVHPDDFLLDQFDLDPQTGLHVVANLLASYYKFPIGLQEFSENLKTNQCVEFANILILNESAISSLIDKYKN